MSYINARFMTPQAQLVSDIMLESGGITHLKAQHYGIGCVRKQISNLRKAVPTHGKIVRETKTDKFGKKYSNWKFA